MLHNKSIFSVRTLCRCSIALTILVPTKVLAEGKHLFILSGQSNMTGHARVESFDYIGDDTATAPEGSASPGRGVE